MIEEVFDLVTPWFLQPRGLNANENEELAKRRAMEPTISSGVKAAVPVVGVSQPEREGGVVSKFSAPVKVLERLGPYLRRVQQASAEHWKKAVDALGAKGIKVSSADDVVKYVRENWMQTALVLSTLASVGLSVGDLFSSEDKTDPVARQMAVDLDQIVLGVNAQISKVGASSEMLRLGVADSEVNLATIAEICRWAKSHFGSVNAALQAHQMMQAFVEVPYADLETAYRYLR